MPEIKVEFAVDVDVCCDVCGGGLRARVTSRGPGYDQTIEVWPCKECMALARQDGRDEQRERDRES